MLSMRRMHCCGVKELAVINNFFTPAAIITHISEKPRDYTLLIYTDVIYSTRDGMGPRLTRYIRRHRLGKVVSSRPSRNPNTTNLIKVWTWTVDKVALRSHVRKRKWTMKACAPEIRASNKIRRRYRY